MHDHDEPLFANELSASASTAGADARSCAPRAAEVPSPLGEAASPSALRTLEIEGVVYELRPVAPARRPRGLAALSPERRAAISAAGGRATAKSTQAVRWTAETAKAAGRKGGLAKAANAKDIASAAE